MSVFIPPFMSSFMSRLRQHIHQAKAENLWLLAGLSLGLFPHFTRLPLLISLPSAILLIWRLLYDLRYFPLPPQWVRWLLTLIAISATYTSFHTLIGRQAGVGLLVIMLCLKLMEMDKFRDVGVVIGLGFFVIITVFLFDQSVFTGIYMLIVVSLLTTAMSAFSREFSPASQWLNLRQANIIIMQAVPLTLLLFVLFPRLPAPLWSLPSDTFGAATGLSDSMSPGKISHLSNNNSVAFRVQFDSEPPPQNKLYWRGPVFTQFDGKTWSKPATYQMDPITEEAASFTYRTSGEPVKYNVTLEPHNQNWMFALDLLATLPPNSTLSPEYELSSNQTIEQLVRYPMTSYTDYLLDADNPPNPTRYLQLPKGKAPRTRILANQFRREAKNDADLVQNALIYIHEEPFYYTRQPPALPDDPVDEFLFDVRRGFCEHYASSFVFLMRAAGIPARIVTGYQGGELNPQSDYYIVRQSDAHAWAEVWLPQKGWQRIDPTSMIPADRIENPQDLARILPDIARLGTPPNWAKAAWRQLQFGLDRMNHAWNQWVINYNDRRQRNFLNRLLSSFGFGEIDWQKMISLLTGGMGAVLLLIAIYTLHPWQRPQRDPVVTAYELFCKRLARRGIRRGPAEGPVDYSQRAQHLRPDISPAIARITALYLHLRYAPQTKNSQSNGKQVPPKQLRHLQAAVRRFKA